MPGMILAKPIFRVDGNMLLSEGLTLSEAYIERLKDMHYKFIWIEDGQLIDVIPEDFIDSQTQLQISKCVKEVTDIFKQNKNFPAIKLQKVMQDILVDIINNRHLLICLENIREYNKDDYLFNHSVNVAVISVAIGLVLGYPIGKLHDLGLGAILHDIGKTALPADISFHVGNDKGPGVFSPADIEAYKNHTWVGYEYIKSNREIKVTSAHIALQHHEKYDGTGFPRGIKGNDIIDFARIATIANDYDILSNGQGRMKGLPPHKVYAILQKRSGTYYDPYILDKFIQKIALYPQSTKVKLSNQMIGIVVRQNTSDHKRPVVRVFWDLKGNILPRSEDIDLLKETSLEIVDVIDNF